MRTGSDLCSRAAEAAGAFLPAGAAGSEGDLHAPVQRLTDAVGGVHLRPALAERFGRHHAVGDAPAGEKGPYVARAALRQAHVVLVRTRMVRVAGERHLGLAADLIGGNRVVYNGVGLGRDLVSIPVEEDHERTIDAGRNRRRRRRKRQRRRFGNVGIDDFHRA